MYRRFFFLLILGLMGLGGLMACGGQGAPPEPTPTVELLPTPEAKERFAQPTTMITPVSSPTVQPPAGGAGADIEQGRRVYENKECGKCHGPQGEGVAGKGKALAGTPLTEEEFNDILRTGGKGKLGNEHLYGMNTISPSGMRALYALVKSLPLP